jgi:hypothetical protein
VTEQPGCEPDPSRARVQVMAYVNRALPEGAHPNILASLPYHETPPPRPASLGRL